MTLLNDSRLDTLGKGIRAARVIAGMTQADLSDAVGVSRSAVNEWEHDRSEPSASRMFLVAEATGQPLDWFSHCVVRPKGLEPLTF